MAEETSTTAAVLDTVKELLDNPELVQQAYDVEHEAIYSQIVRLERFAAQAYADNDLERYDWLKEESAELDAELDALDDRFKGLL